MLTNAADNNEELSDAIRLLNEADSWRQKYVAYAEEYETLEQRRDAITQWLPRSVDWASVDANFRDLASASRVEVVSWRQLQKHVGSRVGVVECECQSKEAFRRFAS